MDDDPIEVALRPSSTAAPAGDPIEQALNPKTLATVKPAKDIANQAIQKASMSPEAAALDAAGGLAETVANGVLGTAGAIGGGLAGLAGAASGGIDRARRWQDWAQRNISTVAGLYDPTPETETGKGIADAMGSAYDTLVAKSGEWMGSRALEATGSPLAATAANTATQGGIQALGALLTGRIAGAYARGISGEADALQSSLDQGRGNQSVSGSSQGMASPAERQVLGGGAAVSSGNPYPVLTGQQSARGGNFPQVKLSQGSGAVAMPEQAVRSQIASEILGEGGDRIRPGVVTGDEDTLRTEAALAKAANPTPQGLILRDKMAQEQRALTSYGEGLIAKTGASPTLLNDAQRGDLLNGTLYGPESLRAFLSDQKQQIYDQAAQRQGPNPVALTSLEKAINSPQTASSLKIAGLPNFLPGVAELLQQFKTNGFENPVTGEVIPPNTVAAAQELRKALNQAWTPDNSMYVGRLKAMIDNDVAQAGGADLYQKANAIHAAEQTLYGAPGVKKIFGDVDPNTGISKGLSSEKIIPSLNNLPFDQYSHAYNIFDQMANGRVPGAPGLELPPELQAAAAQSRAEMGGSLVRDIHQAGADKVGVWNANSANKTMNAYSQKLNLAVTPDVLEGLHTLNLGGQIMPGMHAYEGAALQARRLDQAGLLEQHLPKIGAMVGEGATAVTGIPGGGVLLGFGGIKGQEALAAKRQLRQAQATDAAMEAAAKLGKK